MSTWKILKYEIDYSNWSLYPFVILPIPFLIFAILDIQVFQEVVFLKRYFWVATVSLPIYLVINIIWSIRIKEKRDRMLVVLPVDIRVVAKAKMLFGLVKIMGFMLLFELFRILIPEVWDEQVQMILVQFGIFFLFLALILIEMEIVNYFYLRSYWLKTLIGFAVFILFILCQAFFMIFWPETELFEKIHEIQFYLVGIIAIGISYFLFTRRKVYTTDF